MHTARGPRKGALSSLEIWIIFYGRMDCGTRGEQYITFRNDLDSIPDAVPQKLLLLRVQSYSLRGESVEGATVVQIPISDGDIFGR